MKAPADNPYRKHILGEVRNVARQYIWLLALQRGSTGDTLLKLSRAMGGEPEPMSSARAWRLTIEIVMGKVDHELSVQGASQAAFARLATGMRWDAISEGLHRNPQRTKEIVDKAIGLLWSEFIVRNISEDYRGGDEEHPDGMMQCRECLTWIASGKRHSKTDCADMKEIANRCAASASGHDCAYADHPTELSAAPAA